MYDNVKYTSKMLVLKIRTNYNTANIKVLNRQNSEISHANTFLTD